VADTWSHLKGHTQVRDLFRCSIAQGRLSHAYVFCGPQGIGKYLFARLLAQSLFCRECDDKDVDFCGDCRACRGFCAGSWPDYLEVHPPAGKSAIPVSLLIGEKEKRGREGLCYELAMSPQASKQRIAIINDAQRLNDEGANAILKTLEEPPAQSLILLICDSPESLLPTIRSRCQVIRFFPLSDADVAELLLKNEMLDSQEEALEVAAMSEGSLEQAANLLNPDLRGLKELVTSQLAKLDKMEPLVLTKRVVEKLEEISSGGDETRRNAQWLLRFVAEFVSRRTRQLAAGNFSDPLTKRWGMKHGVDVLSPVLQKVSVAARRINGNSPVPLVLAALFDDIAHSLRTSPISAR
jgi:DNA polymerase III subunit delta'